VTLAAGPARTGRERNLGRVYTVAAWEILWSRPILTLARAAQGRPCYQCDTATPAQAPQPPDDRPVHPAAEGSVNIVSLDVRAPACGY